MEADTKDKKQWGGLCGEHHASVGHSASANEAPLPEPDVIIYINITNGRIGFYLDTNVMYILD